MAATHNHRSTITAYMRMKVPHLENTLRYRKMGEGLGVEDRDRLYLQIFFKTFKMSIKQIYSPIVAMIEKGRCA